MILLCRPIYRALLGGHLRILLTGGPREVWGINTCTPYYNITENINCIGMSNYTRVQHVWDFTITNPNRNQKPSRTQRDQFRTWATSLTRTQVDAQLGLATTPAPSAFLLSHGRHRTDLSFSAAFGVGVGVLLAADSQSTSASGYRASLWDP
jgi:hypothetical protein